jgi:hypothetical protein
MASYSEQFFLSHGIGGVGLLTNRADMPRCGAAWSSLRFGRIGTCGPTSRSGRCAQRGLPAGSPVCSNAAVQFALEAVRRLHEGLQSFLSISRIEAR